MIFDEINLPLRVAGGAESGAWFSTDVVATANGFEKRNQNWREPRRRFDVGTGLRNLKDLAVLRCFFLARAGRARGFRIRDWTDYSSAPDHVSTPKATDQNIGTGDNTQMLFQLCKTYPDAQNPHKRLITKPVAGSVVVALDGATQTTGWSVDVTAGLLTFAAPPAAGQKITAGFLFDVPVRFDTDQLSSEAADANLARVKIPLIEIRV